MNSPHGAGRTRTGTKRGAQAFFRPTDDAFPLVVGKALGRGQLPFLCRASRLAAFRRISRTLAGSGPGNAFPRALSFSESALTRLGACSG